MVTNDTTDAVTKKDDEVVKSTNTNRRQFLQMTGGASIAGFLGIQGTVSGYDGGDEQPPRVDPGAMGLSGDPPEDAMFLWNGKEVALDAWQHLDGSEPEWIETDDYFEVVSGTGNIVTEEELGDVHLHLEWRVPEKVIGKGSGQSPGNSGLFMMKTYEFQILQSYNNPTYPSGYAGSYYKYQPGGGSAPLVLPVRPPTQWNIYDLIWRRPRFENGEVVRLPQVTLFFNEVVVQMHLDIPGPVYYDTLYDFDHPTFGHPRNDAGEFVEEAPIMLQDHGSEADIVQFRNIWYRDLPEEPIKDFQQPDEIPMYETSGGGYTQPEQIAPSVRNVTGLPPGDADVLIEDVLTMKPGEGDWESDKTYGDGQIHVEYRLPKGVKDEGVESGASGVLMMGNYEINVVDTWNNPVPPEKWAGAYTYQSPPNHDSVREPGGWQYFDIAWQAPRFVDGELDKPAQVTAFLNGVDTQTRLVVDGPNEEGLSEYSEHAELPLQLQEAGSEIAFRNTWIREVESDLVSDGDGDGELPPVVGNSPPIDPDGDGLYEDVNGDGKVNHDDVTALFNHFDDSAIQDNPDAYDFNGNGRVDYDDIVELSRSLT